MIITLNQKENFHLLNEVVFSRVANTCKYGDAASVARDIFYQSRSSLSPTNNFGEKVGKDGWFAMPAKYYAEKWGVCIRTIYKIIRFLKDEGYILVKKMYGALKYHTNCFKWVGSLLTSQNDQLQSGPKIDESAKICLETRITNDVESDSTSDVESDSTSIYNTTTTNNNMALKSQRQRGKTMGDEELLDQDMDIENLGKEGVRLWNEHEIASKKTFAKGSRDNINAGGKAMRDVFDGDIEAYKMYLRLLCTSPYLMCPTFTLTFRTALAPSFIEKVLDGQLGVEKKRVIQSFPILSNDTIKALIDNLSVSTEERHFRHKLASIIGYASYHSWLHEAEAVPTIGHGFRMRTNSEYIRQRWDNMYTEGWATLRGAGLIEG